MPRALIDSFRFGLMGLAAASYRNLRPAQLDRWRRDIVFNTDGAMNHSLGFLIMVHDNFDGELVLRKNGTVRIDWPRIRWAGVPPRTTSTPELSTTSDECFGPTEIPMTGSTSATHR